MKKIDNSGLLLCNLQAQVFEISLNFLSCSSEVFIRRFMNSEVARELDSGHALENVLIPKDVLELIEEQYGKTEYGSVKYTANELFWIGYTYRYFSYTYELTSSQVYKLVKPKELREMYPAGHTMDCSGAIERIIESKGITFADSLEKQYQVFRRIRSETGTNPA